MKNLRLPRFTRSNKIAPMRLTERDQEILRSFKRYRFLRSSHFAAILPGSRQQILRRLQLLYHHGYLERPRCQIEYYASGSKCFVYGLGKKGAVLLQQESSLPYQRIDLENRNKPGRMFLEHSLMISDIMVALEKSCGSETGVRLLTLHEVMDETNRKHEAFRWSVNLSKGVSCGIIPDHVFGLEFSNRSGRQSRAWFFLEADRATMPVFRAGFAKTSFYRKLLAYAATWRQNIHRTRFGWERFRVLTVTTSHSRVQNLLQACRQLRHGHGLFLFTDIDSLRAAPDALALPWQSSRPGVGTSLLN